MVVEPEDLHSQLERTRQQLQAAQSRVAELETGADGFRLLVQHVEDYAIYLLNPGGYVISWNLGAERLKGYSADEIVGRHFSTFFSPEDQHAGKPQRLLDSATQDGRVEDEGWRLRKDGSRFWAGVVITALRRDDGTLYGFAKITRDLTERHRAEEGMRKLHRTLNILSDVNQSIVRIQHIPTLLETVCRIASEKGGFPLAWIGLSDPSGGGVEIAAYAGSLDSPLESSKLLLADSLQGRSAAAVALRAGHAVICNDIAHDRAAARWRSDALRWGFRAAVFLPLMVAGTARGVLNLYERERDFFDDAEMRLLYEMAGDIAFAVQTAEQEARRLQAESAVKRYAERMDILHTIDRDLIAGGSIHELIEKTLHHLRRLIPCQRIYVETIDPASGDLIMFAFSLAEGTKLEMGGRVPLPPNAFVGFDERRVRVIDDMCSVADADPTTRRLLDEGWRSALSIALVEQDRPVGSLSLLANSVAYFTPEHVEIASEVGSQLSIALNQKRLTDELARNAEELQRKVEERTEELKSAKERVEVILHSSLDGILMTDTNLLIQQVNPAFNQLFACDPDDYFRRPLVDLIAAESVNRARAVFHDVIASHSDRSLEIRAIRKDGVSFDADMTLGHIVGGGFVCTIRDVSDRKNRERQLRFDASIQASISDAVMAVDMDYRIRSWNRAAETIYGWSAEEVLGKDIREVIRIEVGSEEERDRIRSIILDQGYWRGEVSQYRKDGTRIFAFGSAVLMKDSSGSLIGIVYVGQDISQRKKAEEALRHKVDEDAEFQTYLKALHDATIELTQIDQLDDFYRRAVEFGLERLGFERLGLLRYDSTKMAVGTFGTDVEGRLRDERAFSFVPSPSGILIRALNRVERLYFDEPTPLYDDGEAVGSGWNAAAVLWNGTESLGWLVADNLVSHKPASKPMLDSLALYALTLGTLLAQKRVQIALQESAALYRLLADNVTDLIVRTDTTSRLLYVSPSSRTILGYEPEELIGQDGFPWVTPDDFVTAVNSVEGALQEGHDLAVMTYRARRKDGRSVWLETNSRALRSPETGEIVEFITSSRDITERKSAEEVVRASESLYRLLADNITDIVMRMNPVGNIIYVSPSIHSVLGYDREELLGDAVMSLIHPEDLVTIRQMRKEGFLETDDNFFQTVRFRHKQGHYLWLEVNGRVLRSQESGAIAGIIASSRNITDRKVAEDALRESETLYRLLADTSTDVVVRTTAAVEFIYVSPSVRPMLGYDPEELIGQSAIGYLHPDDLETAVQVLRSVAGNADTAVSFVARARHKLGHYVWIEVAGQAIRSGDAREVDGFIASARNVNERKRVEETLRESEERFRTLLDAAPIATVIVGETGQITLVNARAEITFGYQRSELMGKPVETLLPETLGEGRIYQQTRRKAAPSTEDQAERPLEIPGRRSDGSIFPAEVKSSFVETKSGLLVIIFVLDITERRKAEDTLRQAFEKEKEISELKTRFVSMASHEFRTPLASILALTETLSAYRKRLSEAQIDQRLEKIGQQVAYLKDIMDDVLLLARMQARRVDFSPTMIDLDGLCRTVIEEFENDFSAHRRIRFTVDGQVRQVELDAKLMRQIISNLLSNALKYSPPEKPVAISLEFKREAIIFTVSDQGIGIPEADQRHLFEPFHRGMNVGTISGTGLGLVIAKESVELHGGVIVVASQIGVGTTFIVHIPR